MKEIVVLDRLLGTHTETRLSVCECVCLCEGVCACHDPGDGVQFDCGVGHRVHAAFGSVAWYWYR